MTNVRWIGYKSRKSGLDQANISTSVRWVVRLRPNKIGIFPFTSVQYEITPAISSVCAPELVIYTASFA